jgi:hypothetical protein
MRLIVVFTTLWQKIRCTSQKMSVPLALLRIPMLTHTNGDPRRILSKRRKCATRTGSQKIPTTMSITDQISSAQKRLRLSENRAQVGEKGLEIIKNGKDTLFSLKRRSCYSFILLNTTKLFRTQSPVHVIVI